MFNNNPTIPPPERLYFLKSANHKNDIAYHGKSRGFTLAEVLITLGIIGVVSALTLPNLIADFQKKQTATKLKTTYSFLNQAYQASIVDNGEVENWDWKNLDLNYYDSFGRKYILPYLKKKK